MKVTKYEHACLDITEGGSRLIVCPGTFTTSLTNFDRVTAVVITHIHADHFDEDKVKAIINSNPDVKIYTTAEVKEKQGDKAIVGQPGQPIKVGDFNLEFFGDNHAVIDPKTPVVQNIGVLVNNKFYYPGDSLTPCLKTFDVLAVPASAPWLRIGETIPLIEESDCKAVLPTHNALLSDIGHNTTNNWLQTFAERSGKEFKYLKPGESIEI